ncbi:MAG: DUF7512 family protein [Halobacteriota archaeon]
MIELGGLSPSVQAIAVMAFVLVEALLLYGAYGVLTDAVSKPVLRTIAGNN